MNIEKNSAAFGPLLGSSCTDKSSRHPSCFTLETSLIKDVRVVQGQCHGKDSTYADFAVIVDISIVEFNSLLDNLKTQSCPGDRTHIFSPMEKLKH